MSPKKKTTDAHHPAPESDAPKHVEGPPAEAESCPQAESKKDETEQETKASERDSGSEEDTGTSPAQHEPADDTSDAGWDSDSRKSPRPESAPCTCRCGKCCCHGSATKPQHCVRCHTNYTFNHSQACMVPHVFHAFDRDHSDDIVRALAVRSVCCGSAVFGGDPFKGDFQEPFPCYIGWHTSDVDAVQNQYNGLNVLRCDPGPGKQCQRERMKHHAHYELLYSDKVKYNLKVDVGDRGGYFKRKREEIQRANSKRGGWDSFDDLFEHVDEKEEIGTRDLKKLRGPGRW